MSRSPVPGSAIPIIAHDRADEEPVGRRHRTGASRGLTGSTIERGVSAAQAIKEANDKTERFQHELDRTRAQLGRATDAVREHELYIKARGLASEQSTSFALPPDPGTAELLKRDALIISWSSAYRTVAESAARAHADHEAEKARLLAVITRQEQAIKAAAVTTGPPPGRRADADGTAARAVDAARLENVALTARLVACQERLARAELSLQKDTLYYVHQVQKANRAELDARADALEQQQQNLALQAQLLQLRGALAPGVIADPPPPVAAASAYQAPDMFAPTLHGLASLDFNVDFASSLEAAISSAGLWQETEPTGTPLSYGQPDSGSTSRHASPAAHFSAVRRRHGQSPSESSSRGSSRRRT